MHDSPRSRHSDNLDHRCVDAADCATMVHMSTKNHQNNARLRQLIESAALTQAAALTLFNRGQVRPITESGFKAWLADPDSVRWRELSEAYLQHAERVFEKALNRA